MLSPASIVTIGASSFVPVRDAVAAAAGTAASLRSTAMSSSTAVSPPLDSCRVAARAPSRAARRRRRRRPSASSGGGARTATRRARRGTRAALCQRSSTGFLSALRTISTSPARCPAPYLSNRASLASRTISSTSSSFAAANSRRPVSSSASTTPTENRSLRASSGMLDHLLGRHVAVLALERAASCSCARDPDPSRARCRSRRA